MSKPYKFIPFLKTKPYIIGTEKLRGKINLKIKFLNEIHISKGLYNLDSKGVLYTEFFKNNNKYVIPGTSVKGMIRNLAEMVSNSCISASKIESKCLPKIKETSCRKEFCIICDIFGAMSKKSKIKVSDFKYVEGTGDKVVIGMPTLRTPKLGELYKENNVLIGYKIYNHGIESILKKGSNNCECFRKNSEFAGTIIYEDLDQEELNLLCYSIGLSKSFNHKLGYGKPAYFGSIEVMTDEENFINYAREYEKNAPNDIKHNIDLLASEYSYKNANKVSDYDGMTY